MKPGKQQTFKPSFGSTIVLALLAALFASLGMWQTSRSAEKFELEHQFSSAAIMPLTEAIKQDRRFAKISTSGKYDSERHILLDNQILQGQPGVHVFTPFYTEDGITILVNRGWLALGADRSVLPDVPTLDLSLAISGRLNTFPVPGRLLGDADKLQNDQWPQLVTYLNQADIARALGTTIVPWVVQLAAEDESGFKGRDWQPVYLTSDKHTAYAFQWYALAFVTLVLWVFGGIRRAKGSHS